MSLHIRISYETDAELNNCINCLRTEGMHVKKEPKKGKFKRAYITFDNGKSICYNNIREMFAAADIEKEYPIH